MKVLNAATFLALTSDYLPKNLKLQLAIISTKNSEIFEQTSDKEYYAMNLLAASTVALKKVIEEYPENMAELALPKHVLKFATNYLSQEDEGFLNMVKQTENQWLTTEQLKTSLNNI